MRKLLKITVSTLLVMLLVFFSAQFVLKAVYPLKYEAAIVSASEKYNLDKFFVMGVISAESRFSEGAVSRKSAKGLMQLKDETAIWCAEKFGIEGSVNDGETNIEIGCAYLRYLLDLFDKDTTNALAAYNAGQGNVKKWLADTKYSQDGRVLDKIPFSETSEYIKRVERRAKIYEKIYG